MRIFTLSLAIFAITLFGLAGCKKEVTQSPDVPVATTATDSTPTSETETTTSESDVESPNEASVEPTGDVKVFRLDKEGATVQDEKCIAEGKVILRDTILYEAFTVKVGSSEGSSYIELETDNSPQSENTVEKAVFPRDEERSEGEIGLKCLTRPYPEKSPREASLKYIACCESDGNSRIIVFSPADGLNSAVIINTKQSYINALCWSPDNDFLLAGSEIYAIKQDKKQEGKLTAKFVRQIHSGEVSFDGDKWPLRITEAMWIDDSYNMGQFLVDGVPLGGKIVVKGWIDQGGDIFPAQWAGTYDIKTKKWSKM